MPTRDPERDGRIDRAFTEALDRAGSERRTYLAELASRDPDLVPAVEALLAADERADPGLQTRPLLGSLLEAIDGRDGPGPARPGDRVGVYRILRELGRGGMSVVYLAERDDELLSQQVALKFLRVDPAGEAGVRRFERERQILAMLSHPGIARLFDARIDPVGRPYIVMEVVDGAPIDRHCDEFDIGLEGRLRLFRRVASTVEYAHRHLIVHRDLKPSNIFVTPDGDVKLLDFGIAKLVHPGVDEEAVPPLTEEGRRMLTPEYASPEQVRGEAITTATDVYQLGLVLYELLTGFRPFVSGRHRPPDLERMICDEEPDRPSDAVRAPDRPDPPAALGTRGSLARRLRGDLDNIVMKALEKRPERRYSSVAELRDDLEAFRLGWPVRARRPTVGYRTWKFLKRHRVGVALAAGVGAVLVSYAVTTSVQARRLATEAARTEQVKDFLTSLFTAASPGVRRGDELTALALVEEGLRRVEEELADEAELRAELQTVLGELLSALGRYEASATQLRAALETRRKLLGPRHDDVARTAHALGFSLHHQGRYREAEERLREALEIRIGLFGENSREVAVTLDELGDVLHSRGAFPEAEAVLRRALDIPLAVVGDEARAVARRHLANVHRDRGTPDEAEPLYRRSLSVLTARLGSVHPVTALTRSELGLHLALTGSFDEAEALLEENFDGYARLYPAGHAMEGTTFRNLGVLRLRQGRPDEARAALERALEIYRSTLPADHALVPRAQRFLAQALFELADLRSATGVAEGALEALRRLELTDHPAVADALETLGRVHLSEGRAAEAAALLSEALAVRERSSGPGDVRLEATRHAVALARAQAR
jgi:eukaryotic-like serine/threonine-protein kinase